MRFAEVVLQHQLAAEVLLSFAVVLPSLRACAYPPFESLCAGSAHECQIGIVLPIQQVGMLHIGLQCVSREVDPRPVSHHLAHHTAHAFLVEKSDASMHDIAAATVLPAVLHMQLLHSGHVNPPIAIHVMVHPVLLIMSQHFGAQVFIQMNIAHQIALTLGTTVAIEVDEQALFLVGFEVFHVYLASDALGAVLHRGGALAHLNAAHPRPGHTSQQVGLRHSSGHRQTFAEHLHILASETQQANLAGTHRRVVVVHIHGRIGHEALA